MQKISLILGVPKVNVDKKVAFLGANYIIFFGLTLYN